MISTNNHARPVGALTREDAAKYLGVSTRMLDKYATAGEIARVKLGAKTVFRLADLDAFLASHVQPVVTAETSKGS